MINIKEIVKKQREYFNSFKTLNVNFRNEKLKLLLKLIEENEEEICEALKADLNKSSFEAYMSEIGMVKKELKFMIKNINKLTKIRRVKTPIMHFPSKSFIMSEPYGVVLVMSPWNYPFYLTLAPIIGAISAGNTVVVKPSNYSQHTSDIIEKILSNFESEYIYVVKGGREETQELLEQKFDYIFFTGSPSVGRLVMEKASKNLTPISLELGGKSPCIVDKSANINLTAKRIVWGKMLNSSQTCVAPDYVFAHSEIKAELILKIKQYIKEFFGENPQNNEEYPKIINQRHFERLKKLIVNEGFDCENICNEKTRQIALTIIENANFDSEVMLEELFGPILPIIEFNDIDDVVKLVNSHPSPLALYLFTCDKQVEESVLSKIRFSGGCVNDTIIHLANTDLPFGGVGESGMGSYHGKKSFYTFSHEKSITKKSNLIDLNIRYAPYKGKIKTLKKFLWKFWRNSNIRLIKQLYDWLNSSILL